MPHRQWILSALENFESAYQEEQDDRQSMLHFAKKNPDCFERSNTTGHFTGAAWTLNETFDKVLLIHHRTLGIWLQPGGHADGESELFKVAMQELEEETGIPHSAMNLQGEGIFDLGIHHYPRGKDGSPHLHLDCRFVICVDEHLALHKAEREIKDIRWFSLEEAYHYTQGDGGIHRMLEKTKKIGTIAPDKRRVS